MVAATAGLLMLFYHFSNIAELIGTTLGFSLKLIYIFSLFAGIALLATGGIQRALQHRAGQLFMAFVAWIILSTVTSTWRGGSAPVLLFYFQVSLPMLFITAGLLTTWRAVRASFVAMGVAAVVIACTTLVFGTMDGEARLSLGSSGTIGNSNDLASHIVLLLPIVAYLLFDGRSAWYLRLVMLGTLPVSLFLILRTASRGAMVALVLLLVVALWKASSGVRASILILVAVAFLLAPLVVPRSLLDRMMMKSTGEYTEAEASADIRWDSFVAGIELTIQRPITGVGLGQFSIYNGTVKKLEGRNMWNAAHCSWVDLSSENGIPALAFMLAALGVGAAGVNRVYQQALRARHSDIANLCLTYLVSTVAFLGTITFLSNAYRFYLPTIVGLAIAIHMAGMAELARRNAMQPNPGGLQPRTAS